MQLFAKYVENSKSWLVRDFFDPIFQIPACGTTGTLLLSETTDQENAK